MTAQTKEAQANPKTCFVIAPIGEAESDVRKKSDQVLKHLIKPCLEPKYDVERADQISRPGIITVQVVERIFHADLVIADLSGNNPNVFYELAIRHATKRPAIHVISRGQDIPFDVQDMRFVPYILADPDELERAREQLRGHVKDIEKGERVVTPIQVAEALLSLSADENRDNQIGLLLESLNAGMSNLQEGIGEIVNDLRERKSSQRWDWLRSEPSAFTIGAVPPASGFNYPISGLTNLEGLREALGPGEKAREVNRPHAPRPKDRDNKE